MTETETKMRALFMRATRGLTPRHVDTLDKEFQALLAEHRAEVEALQDELKRSNQSWASARDAALEEAAAWLQGGHNPPCYERPMPTGTTVGECGNCARARGIRALQSRPASVVPVADAAACLGIDLDAPPERVATSQAKAWECPGYESDEIGEECEHCGLLLCKHPEPQP